MPQLYLDCDGVLADFEAGAHKVLRMPAKDYQEKYGPGGLWKRISTTPEFYTNLELMPDAMELFKAVEHLNPVILTGLPIGQWAEPQKRVWVKRHFPGVEVITTLSRKKATFCQPGDLLVDDSEKIQEAWEQAGGEFILHLDTESTIAELQARGWL